MRRLTITAIVFGGLFFFAGTYSYILDFGWQSKIINGNGLDICDFIQQPVYGWPFVFYRVQHFGHCGTEKLFNIIALACDLGVMLLVGFVLRSMFKNHQKYI